MRIIDRTLWAGSVSDVREIGVSDDIAMDEDPGEVLIARGSCVRARRRWAACWVAAMTGATVRGAEGWGADG